MNNLSGISSASVSTRRLTVSNSQSQTGATFTDTLTLSGSGGNDASLTASVKPTLTGVKGNATVTVNGLYTLNAVGQYNATTGVATASASGSRGETASLTLDTAQQILAVSGTTAQGSTWSVDAASHEGSPSATITVNGQSRSFGA